MAMDKNGYMPEEYEIMPGTRNAWKWPFARNSIWNMPIGDGAVYKSADLRPTAAYYVDAERHYTTTENDDYLEICHSRKGRWPEGDNIIHTGNHMYWPKGLTVPAGMGNECSAILQPDGRTIMQLQPTCRPDENSDRVVGWSRLGVDLYGDGIFGSHWGSGLSSIGGSIRKGEILNKDEPFHHALKLNIYCTRFSYYKKGDVEGFHWPADRADSCAKADIHSRCRYSGRNPLVCMGTLLALPPELTPEKLGLKSEFGIKLFHALQDYGAYVVDDSAWWAYGWSVERGVEEEIAQVYGHRVLFHGMEAENQKERDYYHDMCVMVTNLCAIANNAPDNIGGGGKPRAPLAPDFE